MKKLLPIILFAFIGWSIQAQISNHSFLKKTPKNNQSTSERALGYNPGKQINSYWDTISNVWNYSDSIRNIYNSSGDIITRLNYFQNFSPSRTLYIYNGNGQLTSDSSQYWNGNSFSSSSYNTYSYDANGNELLKVRYHWNGSTWAAATQEISTYDINSHQLSYLYQQWDINTNSWKSLDASTYTWVGNELVQEIYQSDVSGVLVNSYKADYAYTSGVLTSGINYEWDGTNWQATDKIINATWYLWTGSFDDSKLSGYILQVPNGAAWKDTIRETITYDSYGNQTDWLTEAKPNTVYITIGEAKNIFQYDGNNNIIEDIEQYWVNAIIGLRNVIKREYSNYTYTGVNEISKNDNINVYPNPFSSNATIKFKEQVKNTTVKIIDVLGKEVKTISFTGNELIIEKGEMKSGIYYLQVIDENKNVVNKKIVVQ